MARLVAPFDAWQRRHALGGFPVAVLKKFNEDDGPNLAALIAYYAFFSLFPLLLVFVSILGFVLEGNPSLRDDVVDTAQVDHPDKLGLVDEHREPRQRSRSRGVSPAPWSSISRTSQTMSLMVCMRP